MAEHHMTFHCTPCPSCRDESWQRIADGRLRWEWQHYCPVSGTQACEGGWGPAPHHIREEIVAREGTVRLEAGGPHGVPLKRLRELMALSLPQLVHARTHGFEATPVEAVLLRAALGRVPVDRDRIHGPLPEGRVSVTGNRPAGWDGRDGESPRPGARGSVRGGRGG